MNYLFIALRLHFLFALVNEIRLKELYASGNPIATLPKTLSNLKLTLSSLRLANCKFIEFPLPILSLQSLVELQFYENKIQSFPSAENFCMEVRFAVLFSQ